MHLLLFLLTAAVLGAACWTLFRRTQTPPSPPGLSLEAPSLFQRQVEAAAAETAELAGLLLAVMDHPQLGGPGFLTVRLTAPAPEVTAQFPNINETLYRRIVRGELEREELIQAGVPAALLDRGPSFETESGGMVLLSVPGPRLAPDLAAALESRSGRQRTLGDLSAALGRRCPALAVRSVGGDLLLSPAETAAGL